MIKTIGDLKEALREIPNDREILIRDGNRKCYKLEVPHLEEEREIFNSVDMVGWYTHFYCIFDLEKYELSTI